jgi:hypothetical protein
VGSNFGSRGEPPVVLLNRANRRGSTRALTSCSPPGAYDIRVTTRTFNFDMATLVWTRAR